MKTRSHDLALQACSHLARCCLTQLCDSCQPTATWRLWLGAVVLVDISLLGGATFKSDSRSFTRAHLGLEVELHVCSVQLRAISCPPGRGVGSGYCIFVYCKQYVLHVSRFAPKVLHFSRKFPPVEKTRRQRLDRLGRPVTHRSASSKSASFRNNNQIRHPLKPRPCSSLILVAA